MSSPAPLDALLGLLASTTSPATPDPLIGALAVTDTDLGHLTGTTLPVALVNTGGAGQLAGPAGLAQRHGLTLASVRTTLADPADPAGNVRRVVAAVDRARAEGVLADEAVVRVVLPPEPVGHAWEAAADEVAAVGFEAALPLQRGGDSVPGDVLVGWIDALLDRETAFAAVDVGGAEAALGVLGATAAAWDGHGHDDAVAALTATPPADALTTGRRWCRAVEVADGPQVAADLRSTFD